jgi:hypothetical protein
MCPAGAPLLHASAQALRRPFDDPPRQFRRDQRGAHAGSRESNNRDQQLRQQRPGQKLLDPGEGVEVDPVLPLAAIPDQKG